MRAKLYCGDAQKITETTSHTTETSSPANARPSNTTDAMKNNTATEKELAACVAKEDTSSEKNNDDKYAIGVV